MQRISRLGHGDGAKRNEKDPAHWQRRTLKLFYIRPFFFSLALLVRSSHFRYALWPGSQHQLAFFLFCLSPPKNFPRTLTERWIVMDNPYSAPVASSLTHDLLLLEVESLPDSRSSS